MKFPRTYHLPWSPNKGKDDKVHSDVSFLLNRPIVITEKIDGENQCWTYTNFHVRSEDSDGGVLRSFSKNLWASKRYLLQPGKFYFVEDISNEHTIKYPNQNNKVFLIAVCDTSEPNTMTWLNWDEILYEANEIGLPTVPELYTGILTNQVSLAKITKELALLKPTTLGGKLEYFELMTPKVPDEYRMEGVVVRPCEDFTDYTANTAKFVREKHVLENSEHWQQKQYARLRHREKSKNEEI